MLFVEPYPTLSGSLVTTVWRTLRVFQKELHNFKSLYKCVVRSDGTLTSIPFAKVDVRYE
jgi:hypothetical protein